MSTISIDTKRSRSAYVRPAAAASALPVTATHQCYVRQRKTSASAGARTSKRGRVPVVPVKAFLASETEVSTYRFTVPSYAAKFGQTLRVVGSTPELGSWCPAQALPLTWRQGDSWVLQLQMPAEEFEFKLLVGEGSRVVRWEEGPNRVVKAGKLAGCSLPLDITCAWGQTQSTPVTAASGVKLPHARTAAGAGQQGAGNGLFGWITSLVFGSKTT